MSDLKKIILLLLTIFVLSGCQVKYDLEFKDDSLIENINISLDKKLENQINGLKKFKAYANFDNKYQNLYNSEFYEKGSSFVANYNFNYNFDQFRYATYINTCFDAFSFLEQNGEYIISTSEGFKCMVFEYSKVDSVQVNIKSNHVVIESNADVVDNDVYTWNIDDDNASNKRIYIKFGNVKEYTLLEKIGMYIKENILMISIIFGILITIMLTLSIIIFISKKNNEI